MTRHADNDRSKGGFLYSFGYLIRSLCWLAVVAFVVSLAWNKLGITSRFEPSTSQTPRIREFDVPAPVDWTAVDAEVAAAFEHAREVAREHADHALTEWIDELRERTDEHFLPWYFSYWTQKALAFRAMGYWLANRRIVEILVGEQPTMAERITEDIQNEFASRVLRPPIAQRRIELAARQMMQVYIASLHGHLADIQRRYAIPRPAWEDYLDDIVLMVEPEKPKGTPVTLKTVYIAGATGTLAAGVGIVEWIAGKSHVVGGKAAVGAATSAASKATAATAVKAGSKTSAKLGGKLLGPIVLVGVIAWDVAEHYHQRGINEPRLRENLDDYLKQLHAMLLDAESGGLMGIVHAFEAGHILSVQEKTIATRYPGECATN